MFSYKNLQVPLGFFITDFLYGGVTSLTSSVRSAMARRAQSLIGVRGW